MRLLLLGGTDFAGRALAEAGLARGWDVTVFHRGEHPAPPGVRVRHGDRTREGGHDALATGEWDAVVDTWSGAPTAVRDAAGLLADRVGRHAFVSSRSVYAWPAAAGLDESGPLAEGDPDADATDFAADKRGSELAVLRAFGPARTLLVRPGMIVGPRENTGRLPWWLARVAGGGEVPAPGPYDTPLQHIDVRDLAAWTLDALEKGLHGPFNLVSRPGLATMGELLDTCVRVTGSSARLRWIPPEEIAAAGLSPWTDLPMWAPPGTDFHAAVHAGDVTRAHATGLRCRPLAETVEDTWAWQRALPDGAVKLADGLDEAARVRLLEG
ncbi:NAD-dependent epimerase/dehydratase family protein [Streptomyces sp. NPDC051815]|uniref:NAD-dependent epimerase/dehydratase family protein n=1 Tax=Streptomyces sp. NPDC051815 TaxID=3365674 RepID=UPI0037AC16B3